MARAGITKGDEVFPYFIAKQVPPVFKGLIVAAILAAAMSTVDSALNCSATVLLLDFYKRYFNPKLTDRGGLVFLRAATIVCGVLGTGCAMLIIRARSVLDVWWQISGIFGGGILGVFILAVLHVRLRLWQAALSIALSVCVFSWATFARSLPDSWNWAQCNLDKILVGATGAGTLMIVACIFALANKCLNSTSSNSA